MQSVTPECTHSGLGSSAFARRYLQNRVFFLFLRVLRCFSSPGSLPYVMDWRMDTWGLLMWVSPFRNLRINGYLLLPKLIAAYHVFLRLLVPRHPPCALIAWPFAHHPSVGDAVFWFSLLIFVCSHRLNRCLPILRFNVCIKDIWLKFNQIYMYAVFKVHIWLNFYQSLEILNIRKLLFKTSNHW